MLRRNMTLLNIDLRNNPGYDENIKTRLIMKMSKNIRNLYLQFKSKVYTENEFENYKKFIDTSFFDLDIPEEIVDYYNTNFQKITEGNLTYNSIIDKNIKNSISINNTNSNFNKAMSDIKEEEKEYSNSNNSKKSISLLSANSKNKNRIIKKNSKNNDISEKENKKLKEENLLLKRKILELKAENVQNKLGKNLKLPNEYNMDNLQKNYKIADELFDKLNEVMITMESQKDNNIKKENKDKDKYKDEKINLNKINENKNEINVNVNSNNIIKNENDKKEKEKEKEKGIKLDKNNEKGKNEEIKKKEKDIKKEIKDKDKNNIKEDEKKIPKYNNINNIIIYKVDEEKDNEVNLEDLNEDDIKMMQYQHLYEQLKKEFNEKGQKFDIEDYMELLQQYADQEEEEGENEEI